MSRSYLLPSSNEQITALGIPPSLSPLPPSFPLPPRMTCSFSPLLPPTSSCCSFSFHSFSSLFSLFLFLFLLLSCRSLLSYPPQGDDDQTSAITLLLFASPPQLFLVFFRLRFFLPLSVLREDFGVLSGKGEQVLIAASIRSDALERRVNSSFVDSNTGGWR